VAFKSFSTSKVSKSSCRPRGWVWGIINDLRQKSVVLTKKRRNENKGVCQVFRTLSEVSEVGYSLHLLLLQAPVSLPSGVYKAGGVILLDRLRSLPFAVYGFF